MSIFRTNIVAVNPKEESLTTPPIEAEADTGSELTWLPRELLEKADILPRLERHFQLADGSSKVRMVENIAHRLVARAHLAAGNLKQ